ncbi:MAG: hypothetical protein HY649_10915 [Acidobacteria bacterium]|nr:hypothetical protein [Acidobacteriota bacterium]
MNSAQEEREAPALVRFACKQATGLPAAAREKAARNPPQWFGAGDPLLH